MKQDLNPLQQVGRMDGMTVPDGYFRGFAERMASELPDKQPAVVEMPRSLWQKTRPYIYLAAMFAGIWCMLQMFAMMGGTGVSGAITPDNNPVLADAIENDSFMDDYYYMAVDEYDLYDDLYAAGMDWNKFMYEK
ncbi:hypothetical protein IMSAGC006_00063 [Muribaculaceae bacterium]|jgi:hypothetical protein|uniref:hypothetical protein n=1 Tax=uncultured Duncaniella sp. TaxID=2768039 RepID=UPI001433C567|nr:hypothetical protein [uncultured Duncaniella sp.]MCX4260931.1 hypothetical protein [Muribaculaceae bacterium]GFI05345.1 hypothetical protein IMSAGC006_00063 [Muribaculaceae bacterium]